MAQLSINEATEKSMDIVVLNQIVEKLNDAELAMEALDKMITYNEIEQSFEAQDVRNLSSYTHLWVNLKNANLLATQELQKRINFEEECD
ncbi:MAG: hypothetical protein QGH26_03320 [Candidatus Pacebacteria bacterium]|jgi:hypothetical protein|nr:hypothetical protein [Candidatus Paceibacterota bacterium]|tara:strand:- start:310 stop:579 length:270 start_codon:yes stop_codon:yes gene_type:complete